MFEWGYQNGASCVCRMCPSECSQSNSPTFLERAWRMLMGIMILQGGPLKEVPGRLPSVTAQGLGSYAVEGKVNHFTAVTSRWTIKFVETWVGLAALLNFSLHMPGKVEKTREGEGGVDMYGMAHMLQSWTSGFPGLLMNLVATDAVIEISGHHLTLEKTNIQRVLDLFKDRIVKKRARISPLNPTQAPIVPSMAGFPLLHADHLRTLRLLKERLLGKMIVPQFLP